jgi:hypothetical protein
LNLISQWSDTICQIKSKRATVHFSPFFRKLNTPLVEHSTIIQVLSHMGFPPRWIVWVRGILSSASSAVLLNGVPGKYLKCKRGVRQGDPLSPLLFVLASELLQVLVNKAANINLLKAPIPQPTTNFPIVQYADDTLSNSPSRCTTVGLSQSPPTQLYRVDGSKGWNGVFLPVLHGYLTRGI